MEHLISIIVPVYNAESCLGETIDTVLKQTYGHWELLLVDDCSTDRSGAIAQRYASIDPRIHYISSLRNFGGPAGPRNIGLDMAKGEFVAFLDADDLWDDRKLELQLELIVAENLDMVATNIVFFGSETKDWSPRLPEYPDLKSMVKRNKLCTSSILLRRTPDVRFDEDHRLISVEDYHLWLVLMGKGYSVKIIQEPLVRYRVSAQSLIHKNELFSILKANYAITLVALDQQAIGRSLAIKAAFQLLIGLIKLGVKKAYHG
jgi:teichuronic acid biosynthesis glycosyltransferase TuaG